MEQEINNELPLVEHGVNPVLCALVDALVFQSFTRASSPAQAEPDISHDTLRGSGSSHIYGHIRT